MKYLSVAEARKMSGLRLALSAHFPAPWGEAAKAVFSLRKVPFVPVGQVVFDANEELVAWTGIRNAPVAIYDDEPALAGWLEILHLAERLGSGPSLLPADYTERALVLGLSCEICSPGGFGWARRLTMMANSTADAGTSDGRAQILKTYGVHPEALAKAPARVVAILNGLSSQLKRQQAKGSDYFVGSGLTAADVYWACFSILLEPLAPEDEPLREGMREMYVKMPAEVAAALDPILLRHRDLVFRNHIGLPLDF
jgi:glutathione S-transferase